MTEHLALGLMSGTSADGVSAALGSFSGHNFKLLGHTTCAYPPTVVERIKKSPHLSVVDISQLNFEIGDVFAQSALKLLKKLHVPIEKVDCIGSHGQTIYHGPRDATPNTLQIGEPAVIAERTGLPVVSNFREQDIAAGGEGAPLIPFFDHYFYGQGPRRAFQNIGGIANVTITGDGLVHPIAFDTGPGNCLMDLATTLISHGKEPYDHNGARAKQGKIDMMVVNTMIAHPYFKRPPPKSTGLELFNTKFLMDHVGPLLKSHPNDAIATLMYFTALSIQESYRSFVFQRHSIKEVVVSGGGAHNKTLMHKLECLFAPIPVISIEKWGVPAQAKEPLAFAFFGLRAFHHKVNHEPTVTGAKAARVLGRITRP